MPSNVGYQQVTVKYFDPVDSAVANRVGVGVRKPGIYSGGYLTRVTDTSVTVTSLDCEIASADGSGNQVRIQTGIGGSGVITVTGLSVSTPYVVLKWTATTDPTTDYMECVAETAANVLANTYWVIVGKCSFPGGTLTPGYGYDSTDKIVTRTNPNTQDLFLKVEPTVAASMYVRVRGGRVSYGSVGYDIADQLSPLLVAPSSNSWIVAIQINTSGAIIATYGASAASPSAPSYSGLVTLAEITIPSGTSSVTATMIKDVRGFTNTDPSAVKLTGDQSIDGVKTFTSFLITPSSAPTTNYQAANKKYVDDSIAAIPLPVQVGFGAWASKSDSTVYQATTDGFIQAWGSSGITIYTDSINPPTTIRNSNHDYAGGGGDYSGMVCAVRKGDYWKVVGGSTIWWLPLGS